MSAGRAIANDNSAKSYRRKTHASEDGKVVKCACLNLLVFLVAVNSHAADDNPLRNAKVGDWAAYKMTATDEQDALKSKKTITAKDEKSATVKVDAEKGGKKMPSQEVKIALDKPYDPTYTDNPAGAVVEKVGEGDDNIKIGDKEHRCHWVRTKVSLGGATKISTIWTNNELPLGGVVKLEASVGVQKVTLEMTAYGHD